jgi:predicted DNA-binding transcriptional regulator AlpA
MRPHVPDVQSLPRDRVDLNASSELFIRVPGAVQLDRLISVDELAALRGCNRFTLYHMTRLVGTGLLAEDALPPMRRVGRRIFFLASEVNPWLARVGREPARPGDGERRGRPTKATIVQRRMDSSSADGAPTTAGAA